MRPGFVCLVGCDGPGFLDVIHQLTEPSLMVLFTGSNNPDVNDMQRPNPNSNQRLQRLLR